MHIKPTQWQILGRWLICWLFILVAMVSSPPCAQEVESTPDSTRALFQEKHQAWLQYCQRPEVWRHSRGDVFVNNEPFREIIRLGIPALPCLMERKGHHITKRIERTLTATPPAKTARGLRRTGPPRSGETSGITGGNLKRFDQKSWALC